MSGTGQRLVWPNPFSVSDAGVPRSGAQLAFYETGTNTPQATYQDAALSVPNTNPIIADEAGQFGNVFLLNSPAYKVVLSDSNGVEIFTADPVGFASTISNGVPVGTMVSYGGTTAPTGWLLCYGQAVSRTTYSLLFTAISTAYGTGNGTTTFNVPDKRGRVSIGKDNMGGSAANRVTTAGSGIDGVTLGAVGGDQLAQTHTHTVTDPMHTHAVTDPEHDHASGPGPGSGFLIYRGTGGNLNVLPSGATTDVEGGTANSATGVSVDAASTGVTNADAFSGSSQNMPPGQVDNVIIFAGA